MDEYVGMGILAVKACQTLENLHALVPIWVIT